MMMSSIEHFSIIFKIGIPDNMIAEKRKEINEMKKLITIFVLATLFLSIASIGIAADNNPNNAQAEKLSLPENAVEVAPGVFYLGKALDKGQVVEGYAFVHYAKDSDHSKPVWDDTVDIYKFMFGGIKWENTMQYEVNPAASGLEDTEVLDALGASLETWNDAITETPSSFELFDTLVSFEEDATPGERDGKNIVVWRDLAEPRAIAYNVFWFSPAMKVIVDSDVVFNTDYDWSVGDICSGDKMDLQSIATHEFGHNGLNDLYMSPSVELTMYGYSNYGDIDKRTLGTGDISGIQALYGI